MRSFIFLFLVLFSVNTLQSQGFSAKEIYHDDGGEKIYHWDDITKKPEFTGGENKMYQYIGRHLEFPKQAIKKQISGRVFLSFVIEADGRITNVKVIKSLEESCNKEAKRVIESFPKWRPGELNGKAVRVQFNMPIKFTYH